jgi:predicted kinase
MSSNSASARPALTLTLMAGLPGVGKTTLARALGNELGWNVIYKDGRKEELLLQGLDDDNASYIAYEESFTAVRESLARNHSVILDTAALHSFILEKAEEIISNMKPVRIRLKVLFLVVADREVRNERIRHRPPQTTVIRVDPETITEYFGCYHHLPLPPGSFYLDTSTKRLEDYLYRARYYLVSNDAVYDDDKALLECQDELESLALSRAR